MTLVLRYLMFVLPTSRRRDAIEQSTPALPVVDVDELEARERDERALQQTVKRVMGRPGF